MYRPTELHACLRSWGIAPKKGLSQNFLIDQNILKKIISAADVKEGDTVLEIGPGPGSLTSALLAAEAAVYAVEKDTSFLEHLHTLPHQEQLFIFSADILKFRWEEELPKEKKIKIIANIPYHLTTPILTLFLPFSSRISSLTLMVQEEVARRMTALPKTKAYSSLTLFIQAHAAATYCFKVSRRCFYPVPKVDSAIVSLRLQEPPTDAEALFALIRRSFMKRRKMVATSLKEIVPPSTLFSLLKEIGQNPKARPEELSLDDFINLKNKLIN